MVFGEEQQKEIATIKPRAMELKLSDADMRRLAEKAICAELTVEKLLESFIGDLVDGTYSNGSDERDRADSWYERCGYGYYNNYSLLHYLLIDADTTIESFADTIEDIESFQEDIANTEKEIANPQVDWKGLHYSNGTPNYNSLEEYISDLKNDLEQYQEKLKYAVDEIEEQWNAYLKWTDTKDPDREKEIKAVIDWNTKYAAEE